MRPIRPIAASLGLLALSAVAHAAILTAPVGRWLTQDRTAIIDIEPCGNGSLCGRIVGVALDNPTDRVPTDYRGQTQCGLTIIHDALPDGSSGWMGRIDDPRDGTSYDAQLRLDDQHRLRVRGFIGIPLLGSSQVWTSFAGPVPNDCHMHGGPL